MNKGNKPAVKSFNFSGNGIIRSSIGRTGPSEGLMRHRTAMYIINIAAIISPGIIPANHSCPTG